MMKMGWIARAVLGASMLISSARAVRADEPALVVPDSLQFAASTLLRFHVFTTTGRVTALHVVAKDFKDPAGMDRPAPMIAAEVPEVTPGGAQVTLTAPDDAFPVVGEYRVTLAFDAKTPEGKAVSLLKTATITRPKAEIAAPGLKDYAVRLQRGNPFSPASGSITIKLMNNGSVDLTGTSVSGGAVNLDGDPKELSPGEVRVATAVTSLKRGVNEAKLELSNFARAGLFQARIYVKPGPDLAADEIPFKVIVSDGAGAPLLVIFLGVLFGFLVNVIATRFKPAQETVSRVEQLRAAVADAARMTSDAVATTTATQLLSELRAIEFDNAMSDASMIKTRLEVVATRVDGFRTTTFTLVNEVAQTRATLGGRIEALRGAADTDDRKKRVAALEAGLAELDKRIAEHANTQAKDLAAGLMTQAEAARAEFTAAIPLARGQVETRGKLDFRQPQVPSELPSAMPVMVIRPEAPRVGDEVRFSIIDASAVSFRWEFGEGQAVVDSANVRHTYFGEATYAVTATPAGGENPIRGAVTIAAADFAERARQAQRWWWVAEVVLSLCGLLVATVSGLWLLWVGKVFGTPSQYIEALVWGFGMDSSVRGVAQVLSKLRGGT